jgi:hypothetical protein
MEATIRESLLALERITTQSRETDRTHRADRRDGGGVGDTDFLDEAARGLDAAGSRVAVFGAAVGSVDAIEGVTTCGSTGVVLGGGGVVGVTSPVATADTLVSGPMLSALAIIGCKDALSMVATVGRGTAVSVFSRPAADSAPAFTGVGLAYWGSRFLRTMAAASIATKAPALTPRQMRGPIGARSGFVPHHRHSPRLSG